MSDFLPTLMNCLDIPGASAVSVIDGMSGTLIEAHGEFTAFREMIGRAIEMVRVGFDPATSFGEEAHDILMTTRRTHQILTFLPAANCAGLFVFLVLQRPDANLALARYRVTELVREIELSQETEQDLRCLRATAEPITKATPPPTDATATSDPSSIMRLDNVMKLLSM